MLLDWRSHFPLANPREIQTQALNQIYSNWDKYDVFVLQMPTGFGKSPVAKTIMNVEHSCSYIAPTNLLVKQFQDSFPNTPTLARLDSYTCGAWKQDCASTRGRQGGFCRGCPAARDLSKARYRKGPGVYNYYVYTTHKLYRDVLIVDEAHNLIPHITDRLALKLWQHDVNYPSSMWTYPQMIEWVKGLPESRKRSKKILALYEALLSKEPKYVVQRTTDLFNGKGTRRGEPEERDVLKLLPVDISSAPKIFWPEQVRKVVLMSATISRKDVEALGLNKGRRVLYVECSSPIPATSRPIVLQPSISVNRGNLQEAARQLINYIEDVLLPKHEGEKGVIHATYQLADLFRKHSVSSRFIYHSRDDKRDRYEEFRRSDPSQGRVLVASGLYEGIDLPDDLGRWQVVSKIPWASLGNPAIKYLAEKDPEWYNWNTLRTFIQACGRVCRHEKDYGITYCLDSSVHRLLRDTEQFQAEWFRDALGAGRKL